VRRALPVQRARQGSCAPAGASSISEKKVFFVALTQFSNPSDWLCREVATKPGPLSAATPEDRLHIIVQIPPHIGEWGLSFPRTTDSDDLTFFLSFFPLPIIRLMVWPISPLLFVTYSSLDLLVVTIFSCWSFW
jgi:hypothetical protein